MPRSLMQVVLITALTVASTGYASVPGGLRPAFAASESPATSQSIRDADAPAPGPVTADAAADADAPVLASVDYRLERDDETASSTSAMLIAQNTPTAQPSASAAEAFEEEYDPWEPFNEKTFEFNRRLDRYVLKPVAKAYNVVVPDRVQVMVSNGFDNISFVPRMMNSLLQGKFDGAVREFGRFVFNSTIGIGGLFDVAKMEGIEKSREDFGQTLGFYGVGPGPYVIVPFLEPLTVRDGIGKAVDGAMDPLSYFVPFFYTRLLMKVADTVNDRSLNLELFQGFEESVIDMYSAVRHGYLKRREKLIKE